MGLAPRIRALGPEIERQRRLPPELVAEMVEAGLFHVFVPRSIGGLGLDPLTASRVIEEVSMADGSAGWCVMLAAQSAAFAGFIEEEDARAIWGGGGIVASTARPIGRAVSHGEEFVVSGRWPFASGSSHATWFGGECTIYDGDQPRLDKDGNAVTKMLFVPRESVTVHDTWDTTGLRGTASNDFSMENVHVPMKRGFQMLVDPPIHPSPLYGCLSLVFITHASQALGVARGAIAAACEIGRAKPAWGNNQLLRDVTRFEEAIAEATAMVESARCYLYATAGELWETLTSGGESTPLMRSRVHLAKSYAVRASVRALDLVHAAVGTSSLFTASPLERQFRDLHTAAAHVMVSPLTFESAGRVELGLEPSFPFF
jgi:alkylation response protein AidB-like acyl-CoA dehydrogenase